MDKYAPHSFTQLLSPEKINREVLKALKKWDRYVFKGDGECNSICVFVWGVFVFENVFNCKGPSLYHKLNWPGILISYDFTLFHWLRTDKLLKHYLQYLCIVIEYILYVIHTQRKMGM